MTEKTLNVLTTVTASNGKLNHVEVSASGSATAEEIQYITIDGVEKKIAGGGGSSTSIVITNATATFVSDQTYADYPYRAAVAVIGCTENSYPQVTFSDDQSASGNYAPFCESYNGGVYLYAGTNVGTQTIPTVSVGLDQPVEIVIDQNPTSGSANAVSSGGVYTALAGKQAVGDYATNTALTQGLATKQKTISYGTADPSGGSDGDIYIKYS